MKMDAQPARMWFGAVHSGLSASARKRLQLPPKWTNVRTAAEPPLGCSPTKGFFVAFWSTTSRRTLGTMAPTLAGVSLPLSVRRKQCRPSFGASYLFGAVEATAARRYRPVRQ
jgi:hypothetical protein